MSIFSWIGGLFEPATKIIDDVHFSGEEKANAEAKMAELRNKLAEIESKVATKSMELQSKIIESETKLEVAVQQHGNWYTKSIRPTITLGNWIIVLLMATGVIPFNEFILMFCGGYNAHYTHVRTQEKKAGITR